MPSVLVEGGTGLEPGDVLPLLSAELLRRERPAGHADDGELVGEQPVAGEVVEGRHEQPLRQVAGGAENDEHPPGR